MRWRSQLAGVALVLLAAAGRAQDHAATTTAKTDDGRKPLPLTAMMAEHQKANMRDHLAAVQAIVAGLASGDMEAVAKGATRIGYSETMGRMCEHMGAAAPGFTPTALAFHRAADAVADAARRGDRAAALASLAGTLQACVACHASWRQEVVDDETWRRLSAPTPAP